MNGLSSFEAYVATFEKQFSTLRQEKVWEVVIPLEHFSFIVAGMPGHQGKDGKGDNSETLEKVLP